MSFVFVNNVQTTLASAITSTATTITLSSSANLPTLSSGEQMPLTLLDKATKSIYEICYVTAISGSSLTVLRAQEGTTASAYNAGDYAFSGPTAGTVFPVDGQDINVVTLDVSGTATLGTADVTTLDVSGTAVVPPATASNQAVNLGQFLASIGTSGYITIPNATNPAKPIYIQWGNVTGSTTGYIAATFPIAFPNGFLSLSAAFQSQSLVQTSFNYNSPTVSGFNFAAIQGGAYDAQPCSYIAIGY